MTIDTEAPVRTRIDELDIVDVPTDLARRRRAAVAEAIAQAEPAASGHRRAAVGLRRYAPGCVALALRGRFDRVGRERLRALAQEVERQVHTELVIDLSGLEQCDAGLARVLGRLRIRCLAHEARVELHDPPEALAAELGHRT
jgi:ABC-type transporter Mla MlaB component